MNRDQLADYSLAQTNISNVLSRKVWFPDARRACADKTASILNGTFGIDAAKLPAGDVATTAELTERGISLQKPAFSQEQLANLRAHFIERRPANGAEGGRDRHAHTLRDIITAPGLLELALSDEILAPLTQYFGTIPFLTGLRAWWMEHHGYRDLDQIPHRDECDIWFSKLFVYLTDVTVDDAPHTFFQGSHNLAYVTKKLTAMGVTEAQMPAALQYVFAANFKGIGPNIVDLFKDDVLTITGKAGATFLANTQAIHRGGIPAPGHSRLIFSAIYCMNLDPVDYDVMSELRTMEGWRERVGSSPLARHAMLHWT
jgi:hypothetical protein